MIYLESVINNARFRSVIRDWVLSRPCEQAAGHRSTSPGATASSSFPPRFDNSGLHVPLYQVSVTARPGGRVGLAALARIDAHAQSVDEVMIATPSRCSARTLGYGHNARASRSAPVIWCQITRVARGPASQGPSADAPTRLRQRRARRACAALAVNVRAVTALLACLSVAPTPAARCADGHRLGKRPMPLGEMTGADSPTSLRSGPVCATVGHSFSTRRCSPLN